MSLLANVSESLRIFHFSGLDESVVLIVLGTSRLLRLHLDLTSRLTILLQVKILFATDLQMTPLSSALDSFGKRVNSHPRMRSLLRDWDREIAVQADGSESTYVLTLKGSQVTSVREVESCEAPVKLRGTEETLVAVFDGSLSPAGELLEGRLAVDACDADQVKLDAIALVLWD